jgi:hypothetical protein
MFSKLQQRLYQANFFYKNELKKIETKSSFQNQELDKTG